MEDIIPDILPIIFQNLNLIQVNRLKLVCKKWNKMILLNYNKNEYPKLYENLYFSFDICICHLETNIYKHDIYQSCCLLV